MTKLYNKSKLTFAILCIVIYVIFASVADGISEAVGISKVITAPLLLLMSLVLCIWLAKSKLAEEHGLARTEIKHGKMLYYIPLVVIVTANLWNGVTLNMPIWDTVFYIISMLLVGFVEEIIFRGLLFKAICEAGVKQAFIISSVTFGIGHIINLLNGAELLQTLLQIISAIAIGFLFTLIFYKSKSLLPCIITHGVFNALSAFSRESDDIVEVISCAAICAIAILYSIYIIKASKGEDKNEKMS